MRQLTEDVTSALAVVTYGTGLSTQASLGYTATYSH